MAFSLRVSNRHVPWSSPAAWELVYHDLYAGAAADAAAVERGILVATAWLARGVSQVPPAVRATLALVEWQVLDHAHAAPRTQVPRAAAAAPNFHPERAAALAGSPAEVAPSFGKAAVPASADQHAPPVPAAAASARLSSMALRHHGAAATLRFVNAVVDPLQQKATAMSVRGLAESIDLPGTMAHRYPKPDATLLFYADLLCG